MTASVTSAVEDALADRLATVWDVLGTGDGLAECASMLDVLTGLIDVVRERRGHPAAWLLVVGLTGAYPNPALVRSVRRALEMKQPEDAAVWLLHALAPLAMRAGNAAARLRVVTDRPLVDVSATAKSDFLTGIQRVVRGVVGQWDEQHDVEFVAWTSRGGAYRALLPAERARLLQSAVGRYDASARTHQGGDLEVVVPWGVPVVLTEVPATALNDPLAALAEFSIASLRLVGYDCIPIASAETVPLDEPEKFGRYLELVKHADRLAGISRTAATEFEAFAGALEAQGLTGPRISACPLPHSISVPGVTTGAEDALPAPPRPVVVSVGTVGRRKNQAVLVEAAELLWRESVDFELRIFGHLGAERSPLTDLVPRLRALGRPLVLEPGVSDARIARTLALARCLVFPSLHEGFGLPVAEALSQGVPVITSDFGSTRELAEGQGGLLVDPEDVAAVAGALRSLLGDDDLHARLVAEAAARPARTWTDYAHDLWQVLVA